MSTKPGGEWIASWRLTRRQLEAVARGELPAIWRTWARRDLATIADPNARYVQRTATRRTMKDKR